MQDTFSQHSYLEALRADQSVLHACLQSNQVSHSPPR